MIAGFYGRNYSLEYLREECFISKDGVSLPNLETAAKKIGFDTHMAMLNYEHLLDYCPLPCILHWNQNHFVVLYKVYENKPLIGEKGKSTFRFLLADPAHGIITIDKDTFISGWLASDADTGAALILEPSEGFSKTTKNIQGRKSFLISYLAPYKRHVLQIVLGMVIGSFISLAFPFLTKLLIDKGVGTRNINIVFTILCSQLFLFLGSITIGLIRSWLVLHVNARISLTIISDFLSKLLKLPLNFFDSRTVGDITQRINDHHRIESFLTSSLLGFVFSILNIIIFISVLAFYNFKILLTFLFLSIISLLWVFLFQKRRKEIDYKRFSRGKDNNNKLFEIVTGMHEIKLFGAEDKMRWDWEELQLKNFRLNIDSLKLEQYQNTGFVFFNQLKNILVSFIAAYQVVDGNITLGTLLSISFIIGQTSGPLEQMIGFITAAQDARLSMDRLQEISDKKNEEHKFAGDTEEQVIEFEDIILKNVSFQYEGPNSPYVLKNIDLKIPKGKITAIVGSSGSGKSTLLKLLLNYYAPVQGHIFIGKIDLQELSPRRWREKCGTVMQEGFVFDDTIEKNIALGNAGVGDQNTLEEAIRIANLTDFITELPLGHLTKIGASGMGLSGGQKQRLFIARAVYKNPLYIFFDEATSSLDANSEKKIVDNLDCFFKNKTVIVVAHRLSTVKNADQIIVLENGQILERGIHKDLVAAKGKYWELVKNQLELGS